MESFTKAIGSNMKTMLFVPLSEYEGTIIDIVKEFSNKRICYVTLNKTANSLRQSLKKAGVLTDNIIFIDCISASLHDNPLQTRNTYIVHKPSSLIGISDAVIKLLDKELFDYLVFDSLTDLLAYEKKKSIYLVIAPIIERLKKLKTQVMFIVKVREQDELIRDCAKYMDKVMLTRRGANTQILI